MSPRLNVRAEVHPREQWNEKRNPPRVFEKYTLQSHFVHLIQTVNHVVRVIKPVHQSYAIWLCLTLSQTAVLHAHQILLWRGEKEVHDQSTICRNARSETPSSKKHSAMTKLFKWTYSIDQAQETAGRMRLNTVSCRQSVKTIHENSRLSPTNWRPYQDTWWITPWNIWSTHTAILLSIFIFHPIAHYNTAIHVLLVWHLWSSPFFPVFFFIHPFLKYLWDFEIFFFFTSRL